MSVHQLTPQLEASGLLCFRQNLYLFGPGVLDSTSVAAPGLSCPNEGFAGKGQPGVSLGRLRALATVFSSLGVRFKRPVDICHRSRGCCIFGVSSALLLIPVPLRVPASMPPLSPSPVQAHNVFQNNPPSCAW